MRHVVCAFAVATTLVASSAVGRASCDPTSDPDRADVETARAAVAANCDCVGAATHGTYVRRAVEQALATLHNAGCAGVVKRCASHSTCGRPGSVTCCRTSASGRRKCSVKRDAARCVAPSGGTACVGAFSSCCDACDGTGGCATTTSTSTTSTTLPIGGSCTGDDFPACTPNTCDAGYDCLPDGSFGYCRCFSRVRECFEGPWPICGGFCLNGGQCIDSFTGFCRCTP